MLCQRCQERPATVHLTKIVGGGKTEYHLCENCAKAQGDLFPNSGNGFDFTQLLGGLLNMESPPGVSVAMPTALRCDACGMTYPAFTKVGRFGCSKCYESFSPRLEPLLRRIQSSTSHTGKVSHKAGEHVKLRKTLDRLRTELQQAIVAEQFERAAELRDEIRNLESEQS